MVFRHSDPCRTQRTLLLETLILVCWGRWNLKLCKTLIHFSDPTVSLQIVVTICRHLLHRCTNSVTSSSCLFSSSDWAKAFFCKTFYFSCASCGCLRFADVPSFCCMAWRQWDGSPESTAQARYSKMVVRLHCLPCSFHFVTIHRSNSIAKEKSISDTWHPCLTPVSTSNGY